MRPGVIPGFFYNVHAVSKEHRRSSQAAFLQKVTQGPGRRRDASQARQKKIPLVGTCTPQSGADSHQPQPTMCLHEL